MNEYVIGAILKGAILITEAIIVYIYTERVFTGPATSTPKTTKPVKISRRDMEASS